jgi:hypothetical protein
MKQTLICSAPCEELESCQLCEIDSTGYQILEAVRELERKDDGIFIMGCRIHTAFMIASANNRMFLIAQCYETGSDLSLSH